MVYSYCKVTEANRCNLKADILKGGGTLDERNPSLSDRIVQYRAKYNLNQSEFAKQCGLTKQTIGAIESGRHGSTKRTIAKINQVLKTMEE